MGVRVKITAGTDIGTRDENQDRVVIDNIVLHAKHYYAEKA